MKHRFVLTLTLAAITAGSLSSQIGQRGTVLRAADVPTAVTSLRRTLERRGFKISLVLDHAAIGRSVGLKLRPTVVLLARPPRFLERILIAWSPTIALDLPLKFLVYKAADGKIRLTFDAPGYLADRHGLRRGWRRGILGYLTRGLGKPITGMVTVSSKRSFKDTVAKLRAAIASNSAFRIPLVLDFATRRRGGPVLIVFGNPRGGTPLMQASQLIGLDLPLKFLIRRGRHGRVQIRYNDPAFLAQRNNVQGQDARLRAIAAALASFAKAGAGR